MREIIKPTLAKIIFSLIIIIFFWFLFFIIFGFFTYTPACDSNPYYYYGYPEKLRLMWQFILSNCTIPFRDLYTYGFIRFGIFLLMSFGIYVMVSSLITIINNKTSEKFKTRLIRIVSMIIIFFRPTKIKLISASILIIMFVIFYNSYSMINSGICKLSSERQLSSSGLLLCPAYPYNALCRLYPGPGLLSRNIFEVWHDRWESIWPFLHTACPPLAGSGIEVDVNIAKGVILIILTVAFYVISCAGAAFVSSVKTKNLKRRSEN